VTTQSVESRYATAIPKTEAELIADAAAEAELAARTARDTTASQSLIDARNLAAQTSAGNLSAAQLAAANAAQMALVQRQNEAALALQQRNAAAAAEAARLAEAKRVADNEAAYQKYLRDNQAKSDAQIAANQKAYEAYLANQGQPLPQNPPIDRSEEYKGLVQGIGGKALEYGLEAYGAKKLILDPLINAFGNRGGPVAPAQAVQANQAAQNVGQAVRATGTGGAGAFNQMASHLGNNTIQFPNAPVAPSAAPMPQQPGVIQRGMDMASQVRQAAAQRIMPAMGQAGQAISQTAQQAGSLFGKGLTAAAPALRVGGMAANAMYSGDLNTGDAAELERRRRMAPTITR